jgi:anti-anti-sigma factor
LSERSSSRRTGEPVGGQPSVRIRLQGEIDITRREETYRACTAVRAARVVVDLSDVTFLDSAGSLAFVRARDRLERSGGSLVLTGARGEPARLLDILDSIGADTIRQFDEEFGSAG